MKNVVRYFGILKELDWFSVAGIASVQGSCRQNCSFYKRPGSMVIKLEMDTFTKAVGTNKYLIIRMIVQLWKNFLKQ